GIRDFHVTGVQTCALPISRLESESPGSSSISRAPGMEGEESGFAAGARGAAGLAGSGRAAGAGRGAGAAAAGAVMKRTWRTSAQIGRAPWRERAEEEGRGE